MFSSRTRHVSSIALAAACALIPAAAGAQQIEELIVTAQRREQQIQNVPVAITALSAQTLKASGVTTTQDVSTVTPGFQIGSQLGANILNIRGVGSQTGSAGDEASVSTYIDGFYITDGRATIFDLNNIKRIEVLKGPQGTLFGRNAVGGLMQIITRTPGETPVVEASVGYGNYDTLTASLYAGAGITKKLAADIAVSYRNQDNGYGTNLTTGRDVLRTRSFTGRSKWVLSISDNVTQTFGVDYSDWSSSMGVARKPAPGAFGFGGYATPAGTGFHDIVSNRDPNGLYEQWGVSSRTEINLAKFDIVNLAQYRSGQGHELVDQDGTPATIGHFAQHTFAKYWTEEFQILSNSPGRIEWIAGAFIFNYQSGFNPLTFIGVWDQFGSVDTRSVAGYAQATTDLGWNTRLTTGVRYSHDFRRFTGIRVSPAGAVLLTIPPTVKTPTTSNQVTWRLSLDHKFSDTIMGYVSWNRGFKSGVYAASNLVNPPVEPELMDAYEVGMKSDLFNRRMRLNVSAFHYKWKNIQLSQTIPGGSFLLNAALGKIDGAEAEIIVNATDELTLNASVSVIDARYASFPGGPCFRGPNPAGGTLLEPLPPAGRATGPAGSCDLSGNDILRTPPLTFNVGFDYTVPTKMGEFALSASYYYNDGFFWEGENRLKQDSYGLLRAQASFAPNEHWRVSIWGRNLLDEEYNVYATANGTFGDSVSPAAPRTFGITVDVSF